MSRFHLFVGAGSRGQHRLVKGGIAAVAAGLLVVVGATSAYATTLGTGPSATGLTGIRGSATRLSFPVSDHVAATVDVGTGNLNVAAKILALPSISGTTSIGLSYNSRDSLAISSPVSASKGPATGWTWSFGAASYLYLQPDGSTIDLITGDGAVWPFTQSGGVYTSPAGVKALLTKLSDGTYRLVYAESMETVAFDAAGNPFWYTDRNGNKTSINISTHNSIDTVSTAGPTAARTGTEQYTATGSGGYTTPGYTVSETNGSSSRSGWVARSNTGSTGTITDITTPAGAATGFTYNAAGLLSQITNALGATTSFTYDSSSRVTEVDQSNTTTGAAGTSTTRFSYPSATSTLVAGPDTSTASGVSSVPHTTYMIDSNHLVTQALDAANRTRASTYTSQGLDTSSSTTGTTGGSPTSVATTYSYDTGTNSGQSLIGTGTAAGNTSKVNYPSSATGSSSSTPVTSTQYLPSSTVTDSNTSATNTTTYGYDGVGNMLTSVGNTTSGSTSGSTSVTSTVTRNSDGTVKTATAPGNGSNATQYAYTNGQLTQVTPPAYTSLGVKNYTYDAYGRLKTQTDGAGNTTTYTYDNDDRLLTTAFSDSTGTVTNTWDAVGDLTKQVSDGGTITTTYDQLGHVLTTANTSSGGTISYGWDKAGNNTSLSDSRGTTTQTFDDSGVLAATIYSKASGTQRTDFRTDDNGNRTDEWLQGSTVAVNATPTSWAAHEHTAFDSSGRVAHIFAEKGPASGPTTQMDVYYCYNTGGSGTSCGTGNSTDMSKLQWTYNNLTGQTTKFTYDGLGRLTKVVESGGSSGNDTYVYVYDARGNRTSATVSGTDSSSQTLTYNAANQITSTGYTYDGAGNLTASPSGTYTYNAAEQMTKAVTGSTTSSYTYAGSAQNAVLTESISGGSTYKIAYGRPDQSGNPTIAQYEVGSLTAYVESDPVTGQATMLHSSSDIACLYVYDGTGSPVALLTDFNSTSFQYKYDPFGLPTLQYNSGGNGVGQNPYGFKSGIQDRATGFVKFGQRWYSPTSGTWTQQDSLDAPLNAANANRYAYAGDDPINNIDPSGTFDTVEFRNALIEGGVTGALAGCLAGLGLSSLDAEATGIPFCLGLGLTGAATGYVIGGIGDLVNQALKESE